jgi:hypothetical protein
MVDPWHLVVLNEPPGIVQRKKRVVGNDRPQVEDESVGNDHCGERKPQTSRKTRVVSGFGIQGSAGLLAARIAAVAASSSSSVSGKSLLT